MKKLALMLTLAAALFAKNDFGDMSAAPILSVDPGDNNIVYTPDYGFKVGESGMVVRWFDKEHSSVAAKAIVVEVKDGKAKVAFEEFTNVDNEVFPKARIKPRKGDEILFRNFYDRGVIISPSQELYEKIKNSYKNTVWVHPDLLASDLVIANRNKIEKNDIRRFCSAYDVGIVYIVNMNRGEAYDCQSFKMIKQDYITGRVEKKDQIFPFFSRFGSIEGGWLNLGLGSKPNYYVYYDQMLDTKDTEQEDGLFSTILKYLPN